MSLSRSARIWLASVLLSAIAAPAALPADAQTTPVSVTTTTPFKLSELPQPPIDSKQKFVDYMVKTRHEDPKMLAWRFDRAQAMIENKDIWREKELLGLSPDPARGFRPRPQPVAGL